MYTTESKHANMSMLTFNSYTTGSSSDLHFHFFPGLCVTSNFPWNIWNTQISKFCVLSNFTQVARLSEIS